MQDNYSPALQKILKENKIAAGSRIIVTKGSDVFEGALMPSAEVDMIVIKLDSGYNIGIHFETGMKIEKSNKAETKAIKEEEKFETGAHAKPAAQIFDKTKPAISILHTGGTIVSCVDYKTGGVIASFSPEDLLAMFPELTRIANIKTRLVLSLMSESIMFSDYQTLAKEIEKEIKSGAGGVIVAHGTDTIHYTSAALFFMLQNLPVPVILVGAQRSSDRGSTDAAQNLINAAYFIASSDFSGVAICMHENTSDGSCLILPAAKSRKMHASRRDAFRPINATPWGRANYYGKKIEFLRKDYQKRDKNRKTEIRTGMEEKVALVKTATNMDPSIIDFFAGKNYKGLIIEGTGLGHAPKNIFASLKKASEKGMVICMASQTIYGRVNMNVYSPQRDLLKIGVIPCGDMLPETAFIKLAWLLGNFSKEKTREMMAKNICGEISERTAPEEFMN